MEEATSTSELNKMGKKLLSSQFKGVYSIDTLPKSKEKNTMFIVNTDTSNLPGKHWIAVSIRNNDGYVFDPIGILPPLKLAYWMSIHTTRWTFNSRQIQSFASNLCGHFCLHFLYFISCFPDENFDNIVNLLYPKRFSISDYEQTILNFTNIVFNV